MRLIEKVQPQQREEGQQQSNLFQAWSMYVFERDFNAVRLDAQEGGTNRYGIGHVEQSHTDHLIQLVALHGPGVPAHPYAQEPPLFDVVSVVHARPGEYDHEDMGLGIDPLESCGRRGGGVALAHQAVA